MSNRNNNRITVDILGNQEDVDMEDSDSQDEDRPQSQAPLKRKLLNEFMRPSIDPPPDKHMRVYLRIRPFTEEEINKDEKQDCLAVENDTVISTHPPKDSHTYKNAVRGGTKSIAKYTFSHIFNENTTQKEFFNDTMLGFVKDFLDGQNCLVFSYGVTSSGKTYTIQGNPKDAGILPRALDVLFNSIHGRQWEPMNLKPKLFTGVQRLSADEELRERKIKEKVLKLSLDDDMDVMSMLGDDASDISVATNTTTCSESSNISSMDHKDSLESSEKLFAELDSRVREEAKVNVQDQGNIKFSVWVSFAEIYNEQIYDLLEPMPKKKNARRPCLKLSEDKHGSPYIKGLKEINVKSADEAYKLMTIGQRNLRTACTKLNHNSSRSHCIFNIKILRVVDKDQPQVARVSMLSLCDLAGSERYTKSETSGERLKEAGNINTSLLTLGRCIETLKYNQHHKDNSRIVPFRESKLTRLFQNFFVGRGKAAMIVNVNQCASMFDETLHVFKFSAVASQVVVVQNPVFIKPKLPVIAASPNPIPRASIQWATPARTLGLANQVEAENIPLPGEDEDDDALEEKVYTQENIDELLEIIEDLQQELYKEQKKSMKMETTLRTEIVEEFKKQFIEIEQEYSDEMRRREELQDELHEKRLQLLIDAKLNKKDKPETMTDEDDEWVSSVLLHQEKVKVEERDSEIKHLQEKLDLLVSDVEGLKECKEKAEKDRNNIAKQLENSEKINDELQKELSAKNTSYMENLQKQMSGYEEKIKELENLLEKASEREEEDREAALIENLTQQLTQSRDKVKEQEKEIAELNDMLTEAGETFEQRETELQKLKDLIQEYEQKLESQREAIKSLEQAAADSQAAMETADQSLSKREEYVSTLQAEIREIQGTTPDLDMVLETPPKSGSDVGNKGTPCKSMSYIERFRHSISRLELSVHDEKEPKSNKNKNGESDNKQNYKTASLAYSSGVGLDSDIENFSDAESVDVQLRKSIDNSISEVMESPKGKTVNSVSFNQSSLLEYTAETSDKASLDDYGLSVRDSPEPKQMTPLTTNQEQRKCDSINIKNLMNKKLDYEIHRPLDDSRVLQIVLTPLKNKLIFKHTKSSMLRLKNSPVKDPMHGRECKKAKGMGRKSLHLEKENFYGPSSQDTGKDKKVLGKRKCTDKENERTELNTSKRRKVLDAKTKARAKLRRSGVRAKYNLRTRR